MLRLLLVIFLASSILGFCDFAEKQPQREAENKAHLAFCRQYIPFYQLPEGAYIYEVTEDLFKSVLFNEALIQKAKDQQRRFFLFRYESDGYWVKGYLSLLPEAETKNLLVFLRGGREFFGLMPPINPFMLYDNCNQKSWNVFFKNIWLAEPL